MNEIRKNGFFRKKKILDVIKLSNGWYIIKTENHKSEKDFKVKVIFQTKPRIKSLTPKHAHFVIDFYGKLCADKHKALRVLDAIIEIWHGNNVKDVLCKYKQHVLNLPGYDLEYILYALKWILEQEDVNYAGRPQKRQQEIDMIFKKFNIKKAHNRAGSELAISLFINVASGMHPVEAFIKANLDVLPVKRARGAL